VLIAVKALEPTERGQRAGLRLASRATTAREDQDELTSEPGSGREKALRA
jgi:hypothetical protein